MYSIRVASSGGGGGNYEAGPARGGAWVQYRAHTVAGSGRARWSAEAHKVHVSCLGSARSHHGSDGIPTSGTSPEAPPNTKNYDIGRVDGSCECLRKWWCAGDYAAEIGPSTSRSGVVSHRGGSGDVSYQPVQLGFSQIRHGMTDKKAGVDTRRIAIIRQAQQDFELESVILRLLHSDRNGNEAVKDGYAGLRGWGRARKATWPEYEPSEPSLSTVESRAATRQVRR
ncbi:hypothetical protein BJV74DRAFT_988170 [Russula compacta]|nr:hypothetical protein BJV74DRAFT_988170 [Russula compacta]